MLTIEEAIKHAEYIVNNRKYAISVCWSVKDCEQIAEWLRELQERRKQPEIIRCGECRFREIRGVYGFCDHITGEGIYVLKDEYCSWAERRTDEQTESDAGD